MVLLDVASLGGVGLVIGYRVLDIETVPDERYWTKNPAKWDMTPLFERGRDDGMIPALDGRFLWERREQFPPPQAHRIVAIAWADLSGDDGQWYAWRTSTVHADWGYDDEADVTERRLLAAFKEAHDEAEQEDLATLVTWNGRCFDLPVISSRSFLHRIPCKWYYVERDVRYRYTEAGHCDVMDFFSDFGAGRPMKLHDAARLAGLPGKVGPVHGADVADIYVRGRSMSSGELEAAKAAVGAYCLVDVLETAVLFARTRLHRAIIDSDHYDRVVAPSLVEPLRLALEAARGDREPEPADGGSLVEEESSPWPGPARVEAEKLLRDFLVWSEEGPIRLGTSDRGKLRDLVARLELENGGREG